ncbi:hypothetical protein WJX74_008418 [Apatococcus lobatus]|uniref:Uncharacterized protein n=1 Tax=Apatococcus lobatus TaxID=904363 RepID=A0AAW1RTP5_9CHLO
MDACPRQRTCSGSEDETDTVGFFASGVNGLSVISGRLEPQDECQTDEDVLPLPLPSAEQIRLQGQFHVYTAASKEHKSAQTARNTRVSSKKILAVALQEIDESVGCCLAYLEELAVRQHLVQHPLQLQRLVDAGVWSREELEEKTFNQSTCFLEAITLLPLAGPSKHTCNMYAVKVMSRVMMLAPFLMLNNLRIIEQIVNTLAELIIRGNVDVYTILNILSLEQTTHQGGGVDVATRKGCFLKVFMKVAAATSIETVRLLWKDPENLNSIRLSFDESTTCPEDEDECVKAQCNCLTTFMHSLRSPKLLAFHGAEDLEGPWQCSDFEWEQYAGRVCRMRGPPALQEIRQLVTTAFGALLQRPHDTILQQVVFSVTTEAAYCEVLSTWTSCQLQHACSLKEASPEGLRKFDASPYINLAMLMKILDGARPAPVQTDDPALLRALTFDAAKLGPFFDSKLKASAWMLLHILASLVRNELLSLDAAASCLSLVADSHSVCSTAFNRMQSASLLCHLLTELQGTVSTATRQQAEHVCLAARTEYFHKYTAHFTRILPQEMVLRPGLTAAFLEAHELSHFSKLVAFQCGLVTWESVDPFVEEPIPIIPAGVSAPEASLPAAIWAYQAWRLSHKWLKPKCTGRLDDAVAAASLPGSETWPGPDVAIFFGHSMRCHAQDVREGLALMSWPVINPVLLGAIQLAAASASAAMTETLVAQQRENAEHAAAEQKADAMAMLLIQEEARTAGKAGKRSQKCQKQGAGGKSRAAKGSNAQVLQQQQQQRQQISASSSGSLAGQGICHARESNGPQSVPQPASSVQAGQSEPLLHAASAASVPNGRCVSRMPECRPDDVSQANQSDTQGAEQLPHTNSSPPESSQLHESKMCSNVDPSRAQPAAHEDAKPGPVREYGPQRVQPSAAAQEQVPSRSGQRGPSSAGPRAISVQAVADRPAAGASQALQSEPSKMLATHSPAALRTALEQPSAEGSEARPLEARGTYSHKSRLHQSPAGSPQDLHEQHSKSPFQARQQPSSATRSKALADVTASSLNTDHAQSGCCQAANGMHQQARELQSALQNALSSCNHEALETASKEAVRWCGKVAISSPLASQVKELLRSAKIKLREQRSQAASHQPQQWASACLGTVNAGVTSSNPSPGFVKDVVNDPYPAHICPWYEVSAVRLSAPLR